MKRRTFITSAAAVGIISLFDLVSLRGETRARGPISKTGPDRPQEARSISPSTGTGISL